MRKKLWYRVDCTLRTKTSSRGFLLKDKSSQVCRALHWMLYFECTPLDLNSVIGTGLYLYNQMQMRELRWTSLLLLKNNVIVISVKQFPAEEIISVQITSPWRNLKSWHASSNFKIVRYIIPITNPTEPFFLHHKLITVKLSSHFLKHNKIYS